jgi:hypothetical protein
MAISAYPRTAVQGSTAASNPQNGLSLMLVNSSTGKYEPATSSTFSGGTGGATSDNQDIQIQAAELTNSRLIEPVSGFTVTQMVGFVNQLLNTISGQLSGIDSVLRDIKLNQTNGDARVVLQSEQGDLVGVDASAKALFTKSAS